VNLDKGKWMIRNINILRASLGTLFFQRHIFTRENGLISCGKWGSQTSPKKILKDLLKTFKQHRVNHPVRVVRYRTRATAADYTGHTNVYWTSNQMIHEI
jgi:phosphoheptose isomerase